MLNRKTKIVATLLAVLGTPLAFAADHSAAVTAAQGDATTNVTAVALAVIGVAAIMFGVGIVAGWLKR